MDKISIAQRFPINKTGKIIRKSLNVSENFLLKIPIIKITKEKMKSQTTTISAKSELLPVKALSNITRFESLVTDLLELIGLEKHLHNSWIFQGNPKYYDVEASLKALKQQRWSVRQHKKGIKAGDKVYIWSTGPDAGILALGIIMTDPAEMAEDEEAKKFIISAKAFKDLETRSIVQID